MACLISPRGADDQSRDLTSRSNGAEQGVEKGEQEFLDLVCEHLSSFLELQRTLGASIQRKEIKRTPGSDN